MSENTERDELAEAIDNNFEFADYRPTFNEAGEITGSNVADAIRALGYRKPRTITTVEELDALPDDSLVLASGKYLNGQGDFTACWIRPIPDHITGGTGARLWEALVYLDGGVHNMTRNDCITLPTTVLFEASL